MKIVIDTNVAVSGLLWGGPPNQLLKWARDGVLEAIGCEETVEEVRRVLNFMNDQISIQLTRRSVGYMIALFVWIIGGIK